MRPSILFDFENPLMTLLTLCSLHRDFFFHLYFPAASYRHQLLFEQHLLEKIEPRICEIPTNNFLIMIFCDLSI